MNNYARIVTVGHGTTAQSDFIALLQTADVAELMDVRTAPGSRHNPQFAQSQMSNWLEKGKIGYHWDKRLGGWRKVAPDSPDTEVRNSSFRAYAGHMRTAEFHDAITDLLHRARDLATQSNLNNPTLALMCSETVWWRCHRRMIADYLVLTQNILVHHLMPGGKLTAHPPMPAARLVTGADPPQLIYDVPSKPN